MDWKTFAISLVASLAWPVAAFSIVFLLRDRVGKFLKGLPERIKRVTVPTPVGPVTVDLEPQDIGRETGVAEGNQPISESEQPSPATENNVLLALARLRTMAQNIDSVGGTPKQHDTTGGSRGKNQLRSSSQETSFFSHHRCLRAKPIAQS